MAALSTQTLTVPNSTPTFEAASGSGDTTNVGDGLILEVQNAGVGTPTVTVAVPGNLATGAAYPDVVVTMPASGETRIPLLNIYRDPTDGRAHITYSAATDLTVAVTKAGRG